LLLRLAQETGRSTIHPDNPASTGTDEDNS
jgi:hypothetical protein